jgi:DNA-directed RNA polymerase subunit beta'
VKIKAGKVLLKFHVVLLNQEILLEVYQITELLEARPSNPAVVSEIDGVVSFGKIKRGNRELLSNLNLVMLEYLVKFQVKFFQENDFVRAGVPLSDGAITPDDILKNSRTSSCSTVFGK